jgi:hypothetical protein
VTLNTCFFEREGEYLQQGPIVNLRLAGKVQRLLKPLIDCRFQFTKPSRIDMSQMRLRVARGEQSLEAMCLACILALP